MKFVLETNDLTKIYGSGESAVRALDGVNLQVQSGEFVAIMGPSGSGKSTLLQILGGLDQATKGDVLIQGRSVRTFKEKEWTEFRRRHISFVFQAFNLIPVLTAAENVALPLMLAGEGGSAMQKKVQRVLSLVGLTERFNHRPTELSGGQQQRVAIARALVTEPAILLADEPTGNLDSANTSDILTLLRRSCDNLGQTIMIITHDVAVAAYADRVVHLKDGRIERQEGKVHGTLS
jgi:putative ABC transport system ATP-binding protein